MFEKKGISCLFAATMALSSVGAYAGDLSGNLELQGSVCNITENSITATDVIKVPASYIKNLGKMGSGDHQIQVDFEYDLGMSGSACENYKITIEETGTAGYTVNVPTGISNVSLDVEGLPVNEPITQAAKGTITMTLSMRVNRSEMTKIGSSDVSVTYPFTLHATVTPPPPGML